MVKIITCFVLSSIFFLHYQFQIITSIFRCQLHQLSNVMILFTLCLGSDQGDTLSQLGFNHSSTDDYCQCDSNPIGVYNEAISLSQIRCKHPPRCHSTDRNDCVYQGDDDGYRCKYVGVGGRVCVGVVGKGDPTK